MSDKTPERCWFRFSLKTLLAVMLLFPVVGWIGGRLIRAREWPQQQWYVSGGPIPLSEWLERLDEVSDSDGDRYKIGILTSRLFCSYFPSK